MAAQSEGFYNYDKDNFKLREMISRNVFER
jgi:hypothetical protein